MFTTCKWDDDEDDRVHPEKEEARKEEEMERSNIWSYEIEGLEKVGESVNFFSSIMSPLVPTDTILLFMFYECIKLECLVN